MGYVIIFVIALSLGTFLGILLTHFKSYGIIKVTGADEDGIYLGLVASKSPADFMRHKYVTFKVDNSYFNSHK